MLSRLSWFETKIEIQDNIQNIKVKKGVFVIWLHHWICYTNFMKLPQQQQQPKKKKKKEKEKEVTRRRNLIILSLQNAQNIRKLGPSERALTLCYLFLFLCVYTMSLFFFYSKASHCALLLLGFLYPELANIFCYFSWYLWMH